MPKMATKAADNVFYKARIAAASWNDRLGSREGASEVTGIDRTRLANIELGTINPHPEEVLMLSDTYNAPELQNHFCSHLCPLGIGTISPIELEELERVTLQLISAMKSLPEVKDGIIDIAADGVIDAKEKPRILHDGGHDRQEQAADGECVQQPENLCRRCAQPRAHAGIRRIHQRICRHE